MFIGYVRIMTIYNTATFLSSNIFYNNFTNIIRQNKYKLFSMAKQQNSSKGKNKLTDTNKSEKTKASEYSFITLDKSKDILLKVLAKPGAKMNHITDITDEGIGVQINAPAKEGEANAELIKYFTTLLGLRKSDVSLDKGMKSRQKVIKLSGDRITLNEVHDKIRAEMEN